MKPLDSPADIFKLLFTNDIIDLIDEQSNLKSLQDNINKPASITKAEIKTFIEIGISMSWMYWSKHVGHLQVQEAITCYRFETI